MPDMRGPWAGIDVGGRRKGFHVALIDEGTDGLELAGRPERLPRPDDVVVALRRWSPCLVAVDAPRVLADDRTRFEGERRLAREVCRLRYTPTRAAFERQKLGSAPRYYEWIECGLALYAALAGARLEAIECFPTASWTRWLGRRNGQPRSHWSARALAAVRLHGVRLRRVPTRLDQDERDAIGAALTAYHAQAGECERFGDIVVPKPGRRRR